MQEGFTIREDGSFESASGKDAMRVMQVNTIITGIKMHIQTNGRMILTRGATITKLLGMATTYTGRKYKRTERERAIADLTEWRNLMMSALPIEVRK